jgi:hypothetical protein
MSDPTEKDLTAAQIRDHELALQVPGLLAQWQDATRELYQLRSWLAEIRDLALSGALVAPAAVMARILTDGLEGEL